VAWAAFRFACLGKDSHFLCPLLIVLYNSGTFFGCFLVQKNMAVYVNWKEKRVQLNVINVFLLNINNV